MIKILTCRHQVSTGLWTPDVYTLAEESWLWYLLGALFRKAWRLATGLCFGSPEITGYLRA